MFTTLAHDAVVDIRIGLSRLVGLLCGESYHHLAKSSESDPDHVEQSYLDPSTRPAAITHLVERLHADPSAEVQSFVDFVIRSPGVPASGFSPDSSPSGPSGPSYFGLFSRPPTRATLLTDSLDDLLHANLDDMDSDTEPHAVASPIPVGSGSTRPTAGHPSSTLVPAPRDDNPFLHDSQLQPP